MVTHIRQLPHSDISRLVEIDRSEHVTLEYVYKDRSLHARKIDCHVPNWSRDPSQAHSIHRLIRQFTPVLEEGGALLGAFVEDKLVGLAILRYDLEPGMSQLALLHVSDGYRRQGIGAELTEEMIRMAKERGSTMMYVSATPSESAVGFYLSQGFELAAKVNEELYALEPDDIHMTKVI